MSVFHVFFNRTTTGKKLRKALQIHYWKDQQRLNIYVTMDIFFRVLRELKLFKERIGKAQTPMFDITEIKSLFFKKNEKSASSIQH